MEPEKAYRWLTILFRLNALFLCTAFLAMFLPDSWMASIHGWLGLGEFPDRPITEYLARSCSLMYGVHGVVLLFVSFDMKLYRPLVPVLASLHVVLGVSVFFVDWNAGMPTYWLLGEGPGIALFGGLLLWLWKCSAGPTQKLAFTSK